VLEQGGRHAHEVYDDDTTQGERMLASRAMLRRILDIFRGPSVVIGGTSKLEEGHAKRVDVGDPLAGGVQILLCRVEGEVHAITTECPHAGGRIVEGPMKDGRYAVCPLHMYAFDPRTGRPEGDVCSKARTFRAREEGDECRVWL